MSHLDPKRPERQVGSIGEVDLHSVQHSNAPKQGEKWKTQKTNRMAGLKMKAVSPP